MHGFNQPQIPGTTIMMGEVGGEIHVGIYEEAFIWAFNYVYQEGFKDCRLNVNFMNTGFKMMTQLHKKEHYNVLQSISK